MNKLKRYRELNNSYKKRLLFNLGSESGFYSEFNNMVFGILYCLKYEYKFMLYSDDAVFKVSKGWEDYFEPFCDSVNGIFQQKFNKRFNLPILSIKDKIILKGYKMLNKNTFFTHDLFFKFYNANFERERFSIPELEISGGLKEASRVIVDMIYKFNDKCSKEIAGMKASLNLPERYAALHIRRGDKRTEYNFQNLSVYMDKLKSCTNLKDVFVSSDDYATVDELRKQYSEYTFYTLNDEVDKGYVHDEFARQDSYLKRNSLMKLFASIEIISLSDLAIGAYTSNIGLFLGMRMPESKFISVQKSSWYQFELDDIKNDVV